MAERLREAVEERRPQSPARTRLRASHAKVAGELLAVAGVVVFMGIITAEALMPAAAVYSTSASDISHLAGTDPPDSVSFQPSATIFNTAMISCGLLIITAAYFVQRTFGKLGFTIPLTVWGIGILGVGIFPAPTGGVHDLFALLTFFVGGLVAILAYRVAPPPLGYVSVVLGAIPISILVSMILLGEAGGLTGLMGAGGSERWVAYPVLLWLVMFGGYLMGRPAGRGADR